MSTTPRLFAWLNEVVDDGYLAELSAMELRVLLVYIRHAHVKTLEAWPSVETIAEKTGIHRRNVQRAVGRLRRTGLVKVIDPGGGRAHPNVVKLAIPQTVAPCAAVSSASPAETTAPGAAVPHPPAERERAAQSDTKGGAIRHERAAPGATRTAQKDSVNDSSCVAAQRDGKADSALKIDTQTFRELLLAGVSVFTAGELARTEGLTAFEVRCRHLELLNRPDVQSPAGLLVTLLRQRPPGATPAPSPESVANLANDGHLVAVNGVTIDRTNGRRCAWNDSGVFLNSRGDGKATLADCVAIPAAKLKASEIEVSEKLPVVADDRDRLPVFCEVD